jgi:hypothetical protein
MEIWRRRNVYELLFARRTNPSRRFYVERVLIDHGLASKTHTVCARLQSIKGLTQFFQERVTSESKQCVNIMERKLAIQEYFARVRHRGLVLQTIVQQGDDLPPHHSLALCHNASSFFFLGIEENQLLCYD